jgi:hypothetical protein
VVRSAENMRLGQPPVYAETTTQIMPRGRKSKSPPCRRKRDKDGAPGLQLAKDGPASCYIRDRDGCIIQVGQSAELTLG